MPGPFNLGRLLRPIVRNGNLSGPNNIFRRSITIASSAVSATQTNFPVLVYISDASMKSKANGGYVQNASGFDILFWSDQACSAALVWEIDYYDAVNGVVWAWVKIPSVSSAANTVFYVTYGNYTISTLQATAANVWTNGYDYVWHGGNGATLSLADSTSNANTATNSASPVTAVAGKIAGGASFVQASSQALTIGADPAALQPTAVTVSAWYANSTQSLLGHVAGKAGFGWRLLHAGANPIQAKAFDSAGNTVSASSVAGTADGAWHYAALTFDATASVTNALALYSDNAAAVTANAVATGGIKYTAGNSQIGAAGSSVQFWNGQIDEVHVATGARAASWIAAEYANQSSPATFAVVGAQINRLNER